MPDEIPGDQPSQLDRIEEKLDRLAAREDLNYANIIDQGIGLNRLLELADQAEKFLHNPIGVYKAARLGKIRTDGPST